ncbi:M20 family metallopeptidase [Solibacillus sp. FSL H8-0538]|uniref:M20 family metallopeptidase n=1 Tax=Solibacillus sp. FSL H8-0538 TaxID=2921400 RepID=UPI0030FC4E50
MSYTERLSAIIEEKRDAIIEVSDGVWDHPELGFREEKSAEILCAALEKEGFHVERTVGGMNTAFIGSYGSGTPIVAILGEFDALSGLSQVPGSTEKKAIPGDENGHGCGHNLLGSGALAAAVALRYYMEENNIAGTIRYYGCPAEEAGAGKTHLVRDGYFDDVDLALTWHPSSHNKIWTEGSLACLGGSYRFEGTSAHAAASPHLGRSALDAVELMNVGVNYLREHVIQEARIHYAITNAGGFSPNVVQPEAEVFYYIRAPRVKQAREIMERVNNVARGAALMTGTTAIIPRVSGLSDLVPNTTLQKLMFEQFEALGVPTFDDKEQDFAEKLQATLTEQELQSDINGIKALQGKAISDILEPFEETNAIMFGSTDVGDVSWKVPTAQCNTATWVVGTPAHTWQAVSVGRTSQAHKATLHAGKVIAATAIAALLNPEVIEQAKQELADRTDSDPYMSPLDPGYNFYDLYQKPKVEL